MYEILNVVNNNSVIITPNIQSYAECIEFKHNDGETFWFWLNDEEYGVGYEGDHITRLIDCCGYPYSQQFHEKEWEIIEVLAAAATVLLTK